MKGKVAILNEPGKFTLETRDVTCADDEVLIKVAVCGLCNWEKGFFTGHLPTAPNSTLGHEWAGTVVEVGKDVKNLVPGDKVAVLPIELEGFAQYARAKAERCFKLADDIDVHEGFMEPLKCVVTVCRSVQPEVGDFGVVIGCGPMGLWCVQALAGHTLAGLIALDIDNSKLEMAKNFGATHIINTRECDAAAKIAEITNGHMADFVIEATGITALLPTAALYLKTGRGRVSMLSYYEEGSKSFDWKTFADKGAILLNPQPAFSADQLDDARRAVELINNHTFRHDGLISHKFPLDKVQEAFETVSNKPAGFFKGVVLCDE